MARGVVYKYCCDGVRLCVRGFDGVIHDGRRLYGLRCKKGSFSYLGMFHTDVYILCLPSTSLQGSVERLCGDFRACDCSTLFGFGGGITGLGWNDGATVLVAVYGDGRPYRALVALPRWQIGWTGPYYELVNPTLTPYSAAEVFVDALAKLGLARDSVRLVARGGKLYVVDEHGVAMEADVHGVPADVFAALTAAMLYKRLGLQRVPRVEAERPVVMLVV